MEFKILELTVADSMTELDSCEASQIKGGDTEINYEQTAYAQTGGITFQNQNGTLNVYMQPSSNPLDLLL